MRDEGEPPAGSGGSHLRLHARQHLQEGIGISPGANSRVRPMELEHRQRRRGCSHRLVAAAQLLECQAACLGHLHLLALKSSHAKSKQATPSQAKSYRLGLTRLDPTRPDSTQAKPNQVKPCLAKSSGVESSRVESSRVESSSRVCTCSHSFTGRGSRGWQQCRNFLLPSQRPR